jgi:hypothetical protein
MAATGFTPIQLYRTSTAAAVPTAGNLADGELAINTTDERLYFKNAAGTVKLLAANVTPATNGGTGQSTYTTGDTLYSSGANTLAKLGIGSSGQVLTVSGGVPAWVTPASGLPSQTGNAGKYLFTNGTVASWENTGASAGGVIWENSLVVSSNYTLTTGKNGFSVGPITIDSGVSVTVPSGQRWVIL